jgi:putative lipoic acid-binding regulatory protein
MIAHPPAKTLLDFPCDYIFKAFGPHDGEGIFAGAVKNAVETVLPLSLDAVRERPSSSGTYVCVSVVVRLHNIAQVHAIYGALQGIPELKYLL